LNVKDTATTVIPDLIIFEETRRVFLPHFNIQKILCLLVGHRNKGLVAQEGNQTDKESKKKQWEGDSIETNSSCLHSSDLIVSREYAKGEESGEENCIRKSPLEGDLWNFIEEVFEDQVERGLIFDKEIHSLEEEDNDIDEDQATQTQT
jgi:hypothetical protein